MRVAEWARPLDIYPQAAYRWFREGEMPVPARRLSTGTIVVDTPFPLRAVTAVKAEAGREDL